MFKVYLHNFVKCDIIYIKSKILTRDMRRVNAIESVSLAKQISDVLQRKIVRREFAPGEKLNISLLAEEFGVSLTPVKEALTELTLKGLVEIVPRRGTFVSQISAKDIAELFGLRLLFEHYAAERGINRVTPAQLQEMRDLVGKSGQYVDGDAYTNYEDFMTLDEQFHLLIVSLAGNDRLLSFYKDLNVHLQIARIYYMKQMKRAIEVHKDHKAILKCCENKNLAALKKEITTHIKRIESAVLEVLDEANPVL